MSIIERQVSWATHAAKDITGNEFDPKCFDDTQSAAYSSPALNEKKDRMRQACTITPELKNIPAKVGSAELCVCV